MLQVEFLTEDYVHSTTRLSRETVGMVLVKKPASQIPEENQ